MGSPDDFDAMKAKVTVDEDMSREKLLRQLVDIQYTRNDIAPERGQFRCAGDSVEIYLSHRDDFVRVEFWGDDIDSMAHFDVQTQRRGDPMRFCRILPALEALPSLSAGGAGAVARAIERFMGV